MMGLCVILVDNSLFMEFGGSVRNAPIMICALFAIIMTSIHYGIDFQELLLQKVLG